MTSYLKKLWDNPSSRRAIQRDKYNILTDRTEYLIHGELKTRFPTQANDLTRYIDYSNNPFKFVISEINTIYSVPPKRVFVDELFQDVFLSLIKNDELDIFLEKVSEIALACQEVFALVNPSHRRPTYEILLAHNVEVDLYPDGTLKALSYITEDGFVVIDEATVTYYTSEWIRKRSYKNELGIIPVVCFRTVQPVHGYWSDQALDLKNLYIDQVVSRTFVNRIIAYQSHKQLAKKLDDKTGSQDTGIVQQQIYVGVDNLLEGEFSVLDMHTDVTKIMEVVNEKMKITCRQYGVNMDALSQHRYSGGLEKLIANSKLLELRQKIIKYYSKPEKKLIELMLLAHGLDIPTDLYHIQYREPELIEGSKDKLDTFEKELAHGLASPIEYIQNKYKCDEIKALAIYEKNKAFSFAQNANTFTSIYNSESTDVIEENND